MSDPDKVKYDVMVRHGNSVVIEHVTVSKDGTQWIARGDSYTWGTGFTPHDAATDYAVNESQAWDRVMQDIDSGNGG